MATFSVSETLRRAQHTGNGSAGPFAFSFQVNAGSDLRVLVDGTEKTLTTHYTVSVASDGTGTVSFTTGNHPSSSEKITLLAKTPLARTSVYSTGGTLTAASLESDHDTQIMLFQQLQEQLKRSVQLAPETQRVLTGADGSTTGPLQFPYANTATDQANKYLVFDANGTALTTATGTVASIDTAADTNITSPENGSVLVYNSSSSKWEDGVGLAGDYVVTGSLTADNIKFDGTNIGHTDDTDLLVLDDGAFTVNGTTTIQSTDAGAGDGPKLILHRNSASPAADDLLGRLQFRGENDAGAAVTFASVDAQLDDESNNAEDGTLLLKTVVNNTLTTQVDVSSAGVVFTPPLSLGTDLAVAHGGTGASSLTDGGVLVGSGTGAITAMAVLADGEMIVGDGTTDPVAESGATLRTSIGVGTGDSPQFTAVELGDASDTTISRSGAGDITIEGNAVYRAGGTDVPVSDGGTGTSSLTDGGVLLGSGTGAITAMAVLGDGEMIVGDGSTDPVAESGATLRTSIGLGTGDDVEFNSLSLLGMKIQSFEVTLQHNGGVVKHRIGQTGSSGSSGNWHDKISNTSGTLTATPTVDGSTAFVNGLGVSANTAIFDVAAQTDGRELLVVGPGDSDTNGTSIGFRPGFASRDVNGTTRVRLEVQVKDYSGNAFNLNTTNLASGSDRVGMQFLGFLA